MTFGYFSLLDGLLQKWVIFCCKTLKISMLFCKIAGSVTVFDFFFPPPGFDLNSVSVDCCCCHVTSLFQKVVIHSLKPVDLALVEMPCLQVAVLSFSQRCLPRSLAGLVMSCVCWARWSEVQCESSEVQPECHAGTWHTFFWMKVRRQ